MAASSLSFLRTLVGHLRGQLPTSHTSLTLRVGEVRKAAVAAAVVAAACIPDLEFYQELLP